MTFLAYGVLRSCSAFGVLIFRLAFGMLSCWLMLGLSFSLVYGCMWCLAYVVSCLVLCMCCVLIYQPHTLPRLSVVATPFMYRREGRCWIPGSLSVLACGSLALYPGVLISRLAFVYAERFGLCIAYHLAWRMWMWWCLRCGKIGLSSWLGLTASFFGEPQRISSLS